MNTSGPERAPDAVCDGGDLDCGSGLLLIIREAMAPLTAGGVLEVRSRETSVREDLPAWCRLVGHRLVSVQPGPGSYTFYRISKEGGDERLGKDLEQARSFRWDVRVSWSQGLQSKAFARNHSFVVGQPASFDTTDAAPGAVEYVLGALGGCLAAGLTLRAQKRGVTVHRMEISLRASIDNILVFLGIEDGGHPGFSTIEGSAYVDCDAEPDDLEKLWSETIARSPIAQSLLRQVTLKLNVRMA